jgi:Uma2 family endonuclease
MRSADRTPTVDDILPRHRLSVVDFHRMGEAGIFPEGQRVELVDGEIVDMTPIGSGHSGTINRLAKAIERAVGDRAIVAIQNPVVFGQHSELQPDLALLKPREDFYSRSHPGPTDVLLLVEVADSSLRYDREVKIPLYARHGLPEVWLVDLVHRQLLVHRSPDSGGFREVRVADALEDLRPMCLADIGIDLRGIT